ncbi:hypothetical protein ACFE04_004104 [Oxalis oulophora]
MPLALNFTAAYPRAECAVYKPSNFGFNSTRTPPKYLRPYQDATFRISQPSSSSLGCSRKHNDVGICAAVVDERIANGRDMAEPSGTLAYDLIQGDLVQWNSITDKSMPDPPTAVLLHGILGSRKNWGTFARRLAQEFPTWQFLLVDLRCHGDSASIKMRGPHNVASTALDVLKLVRQLRITPRILVGHSFGGKVVLSMVDQAAKPLARPVRVWVLDATPGKVRAGGDGEDHPAELISFLRTLPKMNTSYPGLISTFCYLYLPHVQLLYLVTSKREVVNALIQKGFSNDVAQWVVTNLKPAAQLSSSSFSWTFDLDGIAEMRVVENLPRGVHVNFLKAERSLHRWALEDLQRIHAAEELASDEAGGVEMHVLEDAGHWVHADNPDGLFRILSSSFQGFKS